MLGSAGKMMILAGALLMLVGALLWAAERVGIGRGGGLLPGDLVWRRGDWTFGLFLGTSIMLSVLLTLLLWVIGWLSRR